MGLSDLINLTRHLKIVSMLLMCVNVTQTWKSEIGNIFVAEVYVSKAFERLVSVRLRRFMEHSFVLPKTQFAHRKGLVPVMHFYGCPIHSKVYRRVGRRLGSCRLISVQPLIGSTIRDSL